MDDAHLEELRRAKHLLENPGPAMKLADWAGRPVELGLKALPARARTVVISASGKAMEKVLDAALFTLQKGVGPNEHFQDMAWGHFTIRRLERQYGAQVVQEAYAECEVSKERDRTVEMLPGSPLAASV